MMRVYHFLPAEFALVSIALQRIKVARLSEVNDPFELRALNVGGRKKFRKALAGWKDELNETKGMLCFSKSWQNPVLWSHYANRHHGICLGFDITDDLVRDVDYEHERILAKVEDSDTFDVGENLVESLLYTKYSHWGYEEEVRAYVDLDPSAAEGGMHFFDFSGSFQLREIILGPLCEIPVEKAREMVAESDPRVYVKKGRLAFKFFKVVEDERFRHKSGS